MHQTHHTMADFEEIYSYLENAVSVAKQGQKDQQNQQLHTFPETFLTGYPLQDLCLERSFIERYTEFMEKVAELANVLTNDSVVFLIGGLKYSFDAQGLPLTIENVIYELKKGSFKDIYTKKLLPNYDIFDEKKYYTPGQSTSLYKAFNKNVGLLICEDMWYSSHHSVNPLDELEEDCSKNKIALDVIINLSSSPFNLQKEDSRVKRASDISSRFKCPFVYVNKVGAEDEILFDGSSFVLIGNNVLIRAKMFEKDLLSFELENITWDEKKAESNKEMKNSWEELFAPSLNFSGEVPTLVPLSDFELEKTLHAIKLGIQDYARKCGMKHFLVALSGGIDSALVLAILRLIKEEDQNIEAVYMPGFFSATLSYELSRDLCKNLGIKLYNLPIKFLHSNTRNLFKETFGTEMIGLADENIQSRLRGNLLYARSNQTGAMVINTSNKSELSVGYSTLYGDSVGAISMLGDLYKTEVFALARFINKKFGNIIPEGIIDRPPSAELRENQEDAHSLPPYERLDAMLEGLLSYRLGPKDLIQRGFSSDEVTKVYRLYNIAEYKRYQFCPIIKLKAKSFGFGYRNPICKKF